MKTLILSKPALKFGLVWWGVAALSTQHSALGSKGVEGDEGQGVEGEEGQGVECEEGQGVEGG